MISWQLAVGQKTEHTVSGVEKLCDWNRVVNHLYW